MHVLSPLVPSRELFFLRYCEQIEAHSWVIVDVSVDCTTGNNNPTYWKFPSGCIIHEISNELCWVSIIYIDKYIGELSYPLVYVLLL